MKLLLQKSRINRWPRCGRTDSTRPSRAARGLESYVREKSRFYRAIGNAVFTAVLLAASAVPAFAQDTTLESVNSNEVKGDQGSWYPSISADGRYVAFVSQAQNLAPNVPYPCSFGSGPDYCYQIYVRDRVLGVTTRVSVNAAGEQGNANSAYPTISANGRFVAFNSNASNLVPGDLPGLEVFVHDRDSDGNGIYDEPGGISVRRVGDAWQADFVYPNSISGDGRLVVFYSTGLGSVRAGQVFLYDLQQNSLVMISAAGNGVATSNYAVISADGNTVAYISWARLVDEDTNGDPAEVMGCIPSSSIPCGADVYVYDRNAGETTRVSVSSDGEQANGPSDRIPLTLSADGRYVGFASAATNLVDDDSNDLYDIFVHDRLTGTTVMASRDSNGNPGDQESQWPGLSADGRFIAFGSRSQNLAPGGEFGGQNIYLRDLLNGSTSLVNAGMNGEIPDGSSWDPSVSATGRFVVFWSIASNLAPGDSVRNSQDIFVRDMFPNGCPGGEQDTGSLLVYSGDLLVAAGTGGWADVVLDASLLDSAQDPISGEQVTFTLEGSSGSTTFDCGPTDSNGQVACVEPLAPDVYSLSLSFEGGECNSAANDQALIVVYDPNQPRATGGGFFYPDDESTQPGYGNDKAHFGFVAYINKQSAAAGNLEFQYQAAGINLKSMLMTWYTVSANRAMFQGEATINETGLFTFRVQAIDGDQTGLADHFDIVIWEGTDTEAAPIHRAKNDLAGGNILVRKR
jgi:Tol biopolymer transport system component